MIDEESEGTRSIPCMSSQLRVVVRGDSGSLPLLFILRDHLPGADSADFQVPHSSPAPTNAVGRNTASAHYHCTSNVQGSTAALPAAHCR